MSAPACVVGFVARGDGPEVAAEQVRTNVVALVDVLQKAGIKSVNE